MDPFARHRDVPPQPSSIIFAPPNQPANRPLPDVSRYPPDPQSDFDKPDPNIAFMKGPKRKRLAKVRLHLHLSPSSLLTPQEACDACHKSKRRCDGTGMLPQPLQPLHALTILIHILFLSTL